ncbi:uncharacterized protein LOC134264594 [Saccostrea cucullata]|uniref:uncharacterized protein LOC134264594 n=1 Tax=Saccostrea cuccullata TaxID=36930 RepID=UPI002ED5BC9F
MASNPGERIPQTDDPRARSAGHLCIKWCNEETAKSFRLPVHYLAKPLYEIEVLCSNEDYYKLQYMFQNEKMQKTLAEFLTETKYRIQKTDQQLVISMGQNLDKDSKTVLGEIEGILTTMKNSIKIVFAGKKSDVLQMENTLERLSEKCKKGNISVYPDKEGVWLVAEKEEELKAFCRTIANEYFDCEEVLLNLKQDQRGHVHSKARTKRRGKIDMLSLGIDVGGPEKDSQVSDQGSTNVITSQPTAVLPLQSNSSTNRCKFEFFF